jgi:hypothetical protein
MWHLLLSVHACATGSLTLSSIPKPKERCGILTAETAVRLFCQGVHPAELMGLVRIQYSMASPVFMCCRWAMFPAGPVTAAIARHTLGLNLIL